MPKSSKSKKRKKKNKKISHSQSILKTRIPHSAALVLADDVEDKNFLISYRYYNDKLCQIVNLQGGRARKVLTNIKIVGKSTSTTLLKNGVRKIRVSNSGDYSKLYNKLPEDVELYEDKPQGDSRMFYFFVGRIFHLVAIKNSHFDTTKNRK